jgi:isocitrate dehydrogenase (NAD+)
MQSAVLMLAHIGERDASRLLQKAIEGVYAEGKHLTGDLGGKASTSDFAAAIIAHMRDGARV